MHCGSSIPQIIVVHVNEEIGKLREEVVIIEYGVWDLDGWPRIWANQLSFGSHHILSLGGDLEGLKNGDFPLLPEHDSRILSADKKYKDIYVS